VASDSRRKASFPLLLAIELLQHYRGLYSTGKFTIPDGTFPDNIHPNVKSEEFLQRKRMIEEWMEKEMNIGTFSIPVVM